MQRRENMNVLIGILTAVLIIALILSLRVKVFLRLEDVLTLRAGLGPVVLRILPKKQKEIDLRDFTYEKHQKRLKKEQKKKSNKANNKENNAKQEEQQITLFDTQPSAPDVDLSPEETRILNLFTAEPLTIEEAAYLSKLPMSDLMSILSMLELYGLIEPMVGRKYIRIG